MDEEIIRKVPLFANLPSEEIAHLASSLRRTGWGAGQVLFREDETGDRFYIVFRGRVAIIQGLGTHDERVVAERGEGEFIGEQSLLSPDGLRTASARAMENCLLLEMTRADFNAVLRRNPLLAYEMLRVQSVRLKEATDAAMDELREHNRRLSEAYSELREAQAQIVEQETLERELRLARAIQMRMLPAVLPAVPGYDLGAVSAPARTVGGDFYDVFPLDSDRVAVAIGDVSGKGIPAALLMGLICALLRVEARHGGSPEEVVQRVNGHLLDRKFTEFVSLLYGVLYTRSGEFSYVRAGHELPIISNSHSVHPVRLGQSLPLGLFEELTLDSQTIRLSPRSTLLLYTDGVTEAFNPKEGPFGDARLLEILAAGSHDSSQALCNSILEKVLAYQGSSVMSDDITIVALRNLAAPGRGESPQIATESRIAEPILHWGGQ
jgi:serine phosphatase RsbU (regulator of sigma subunit)